ncbi:hypothetical protein B0T16DRAFT_447889 [Cercophora newfieldiana]|uniref:NmrA-like domain-containing protein n=1 Tax=Cercophora newfieldiana TaxID=92897 RepID=A0AA39Y194_9PEZI|nr:hypothetical protein B0T16DRAFT_447889 [Cercophora newfieldiana]
MAQRFPHVALLGVSVSFVGTPGCLWVNFSTRHEETPTPGGIGKHRPSPPQALRQAQPPFESITVVTRATPSPDAFPPDIKIKVVGYSSKESISVALSGVNAIVSALPIRSASLQSDIIDAAVEAGVKFFIPSEYGLASTDKRINADFKNWLPKYEIAQKLAGLKQEGKIDYALVFTGLFLDWGMEGIFLDLKNKRVALWDDGNSPISLTTVASIGKAVVGVLQGKVDGTEVRIKDINLTHRRLYELAAQAVGGEWTVKSGTLLMGWLRQRRIFGMAGLIGRLRS